jgi:DNA polymerase-3 subunit delta'
MKFSEVIGQQQLKQRLINTVKENRISHAQLFAGTEGCGSLALAIAYAQYICCENPTETDSCGVCKSCQKYNKLIHPDLHFVFPVVNTSAKPKAVSDDYLTEWRSTLIDNPYMNMNFWVETISSENKQGGIFERESGEILRKLSLKTYEAEYKIMIIWMPEKMHVVASNKLLKLLEEPPAKTLFILVSENPGQLIATILSRCQYIKVVPVENDEIAKALSEKGLDDSRVKELTRLASGNYFKALELISNQEDESFYFNLFANLMRLSYARKIPEIYKLVDELAALGREKQKKLLQCGLRLLRENFTLNIANPSLVYLNNEENAFSQKFHPYIRLENIYQLTEEFNKASYHIESNGNAKIIFLDMALKIVKLIKQ